MGREYMLELTNDQAATRRPAADVPSMPAQLAAPRGRRSQAMSRVPNAPLEYAAHAQGQQGTKGGAPWLTSGRTLSSMTPGATLWR
jgi:hypothetical protein